MPTMDFLPPSPSSWFFVGDVDEAASATLEASPTPSSLTRRVSVDAQRSLPKADDVAAPVSRVRTMSADASSWMMKPSNETNASASTVPTTLVPKKMAHVVSDRSSNNADRDAVHGGTAEVVSDDSNVSAILTTNTTFPKKIVQAVSDNSKVETVAAIRTNPGRLEQVGSDKVPASPDAAGRKIFQKMTWHEISDRAEAEQSAVVTKLTPSKPTSRKSTNTIESSDSNTTNQSPNLDGDDDATSTKTTEVSLVASLKSNLFKEETSPKMKLVKASSFRMPPVSEKPRDITLSTDKSKSDFVVTKSDSLSTLLVQPSSPNLSDSSNITCGSVPRRASVDSSWMVSHKPSSQEKRVDRPPLGPMSPRFNVKKSKYTTPSPVEEAVSSNSKSQNAPENKIDKSPRKTRKEFPVSEAKLNPEPRQGDVDSMAFSIPQNEKRSDRPPRGPLSPRLVARRASADSRPAQSNGSEATAHADSATQNTASQVQQAAEKPPLCPLVSPRHARRASADSGPKSPEPTPKDSDKSSNIQRRLSADSSSWQNAQNVTIQGKRIDPKKECTLNSSISDLKTRFSGSSEAKLGQTMSKVDPRQECMFNSSVRELKEVFDPTVIEIEPEEPEFDLLTDSPIREARKSAKILDVISQLGKSGERSIPKIDPLDEILNSSKCSLGSFANSFENDKNCGEGSLTDIFGEETKTSTNANHAKEASGRNESQTDGSLDVEEEEAAPVLPAKLSKEERRRRARMLWQSELSMNSSLIQTSPNASFVQSSPHASFTAISSDA